MKINYYEAFDLIAEEAVDLLAEHQSDDSFLDKFSVEDTLNAVHGNMTQKKVVKKRIPMKIKFLIAAVMVLMVAAVSFADENEFKTQLITDENRHLVGKEGMADADSILIIDKEGNIVSGKISEPPTKREVWGKSTVVKRVKADFIPSSVTEIKVKKEGDAYITPEIITWNGDVVILTKGDGDGWELEKGQSLTLDVDLYPNEYFRERGQIVVFYKIYNGTFYSEDRESERSIEKHYEIKANRKGEYYIAFGNNSSDSISFKEGVIKIQ